ncbi:MAG: polysaccharide deacetylase family protein, partial [Clostridiaceae bacterium]
MVGNRVASYASTVKRMADLGCETDSHTWAHTYARQVLVSSIGGNGLTLAIQLNVKH